MRIASFRVAANDRQRVGSPLVHEGTSYLVDLTRARAWSLADRGEAFADQIARSTVPPRMESLLQRGDRGIEDARSALAAVGAHVDSSGPDELVRAGVLVADSDAQYLPSVPRPGKALAVGMNYHAHFDEASGYVPRPEPPPYPLAFAKFASTLVGHRAPIRHPDDSDQLDYEGELCLVIGRRCRNVAPDRYLEVVAGFTIMNDVSLRDIQRDEMSRGVLTMGKNRDSLTPMGPWLVTRDEIADPQRLRITTKVDGAVRQDDTTASMIHPLGDIVAYWSRMTLEPGDVISTGTPSGVGIFLDPPSDYLLRPGQTVEVEVEGVGILSNPVVAAMGGGDL